MTFDAPLAGVSSEKDTCKGPVWNLFGMLLFFE